MSNYYIAHLKLISYCNSTALQFLKNVKLNKHKERLPLKRHNNSMQYVTLYLILEKENK